MMATPEILRRDAATLDSLMYAFEQSYMTVCEVTDHKQTAKERDRACYMLYALRDLTEKIKDEIEELCEHGKVCDILRALKESRGGECNG